MHIELTFSSKKTMTIFFCLHEIFSSLTFSKQKKFTQVQQQMQTSRKRKQEDISTEDGSVDQQQSIDNSAASAKLVNNNSVDDTMQPSSKKQRESAEHQQAKYKYHNYLPQPFKQQFVQESDTMRKHMLEVFRQFFAKPNILNELHVKANWEEADAIMSKVRRYEQKNNNNCIASL